MPESSVGLAFPWKSKGMKLSGLEPSDAHRLPYALVGAGLTVIHRHNRASD
jgi:hypothetical protein